MKANKEMTREQLLQHAEHINRKTTKLLIITAIITAFNIALIVWNLHR